MITSMYVHAICILHAVLTGIYRFSRTCAHSAGGGSPYSAWPHLHRGVQEVCDLDKVRLGEAARGERAGANADAARRHCTLITGHRVLCMRGRAYVVARAGIYICSETGRKLEDLQWRQSYPASVSQYSLFVQAFQVSKGGRERQRERQFTRGTLLILSTRAKNLLYLSTF